MIYGVVGSGVSLTLDDVKRLRSQCDYLIAVNSSFLIAPDLFDYVYASDSTWWNANYNTVPSLAIKVTSSVSAAARHKSLLLAQHFIVGTYSSGGRAIELAIMLGASKVVLLGMDCNLKDGSHFFGEHKNLNNPTQKSVRQWLEHFERIACKHKNIEILNCTRGGNLECFKREVL